MKSNLRKRNPLQEAGVQHKRLEDQGVNVEYASLMRQLKNPRVQKALNAVTSSLSKNKPTRRRQMQQLESYDAGKLGISIDEFREWLSIESHYNPKQKILITKILALDDFASVAAIGLPLVKKYGGKALSYIYQKFGRGKSQFVDDAVDYFMPGEYTNEKEEQPPTLAMNAINNPTPGIQSDPRKGILETRQERYNNSPLAFRLADYALDAVNIDALCTWVCPEVYLERICDQYQIDASAITRADIRIPVTTDANGNAGIWINPHAWNAASGANAWFALLTQNYATLQFNPATGAYNQTITTGGYTTAASPFTATANTIADAMGVGMSLRFVPVMSDLNNGGFLEYAQFKTTANGTFLTAYPQATLQQVQNNPYYSFSNMKVETRHIWIPTDSADFQYTEISSAVSAGTAPYSDLFYYVFQGCQVSTTIGEIVITDARQYHPHASMSLYVQSTQAKPGPATRSLVAALIKAAPTLECLTMLEAKAFCQALRDVPPIFGNVLQAAVNVISQNSIQESYPIDYTKSFAEQKARANRLANLAEPGAGAIS
jgi:hypothetical protein